VHLVGETLAFGSHSAMAASAVEISRDANARLQQLYASVPAANALGGNAGLYSQSIASWRDSFGAIFA